MITIKNMSKQTLLISGGDIESCEPNWQMRMRPGEKESYCEQRYLQIEDLQDE